MEGSASSAFPLPPRIPLFHSDRLAFVQLLGEEPPPGRRRPPREDERKAPEREQSVLLIDDELDSLEAVRELLESEGIEVLTAEDGREALRLLRRGRRPSLIVLDLRMPHMDGWEFCRLLDTDEALREIPVAIVTASASFGELPVRRQDAGFFSKPIDFNAFLRTVKRYCG